MKELIFIMSLISLGNVAFASGKAGIPCLSEHTRVRAYHFGFSNTFGVNNITMGCCFGDPLSPNDSIINDGPDVIIQKEGGLRFVLKGVFETHHGPSHPIPTYELQVPYNTNYYTIEKGECTLI